jgi:hypothetical protein
MILILTNPSDDHADVVARELSARGVETVRFGWCDFPTQVVITARRGSREVTSLTRAKECYDLLRCAAVWLRRPLQPRVSDRITDPSLQEYAKRECAEFLEDIFASLEVPWLPALPNTMRLAGLKTRQLAVAAAVGFAVPETLVTNDPQAFYDFYEEQHGALISKLPGSALHSFNGQLPGLQPLLAGIQRLTEHVTRFDLAAAPCIELAPVTFQQEIDKAFELRVTVVGERVFAARIDSQQNMRTRSDWRRYDLDHTPHSAYELTPEVARRCVTLTHRLGLCFGAIDLIVTPAGECVFLEINPGGQYLWIEEMTGLPISAAICDLLASREHIHL